MYMHVIYIYIYIYICIYTHAYAYMYIMWVLPLAADHEAVVPPELVAVERLTSSSVRHRLNGYLA